MYLNINDFIQIMSEYSCIKKMYYLYFNDKLHNKVFIKLLIKYKLQIDMMLQIVFRKLKTAII